MSDVLDVVGLGQCSLDQVARLPHVPPFAGKVEMLSWSEHPGGQIATAVLTCARLGLRASFLTSVGDDRAGEACLAPLAREGVAIDGIKICPGVRSQGAMILVDEDSGERTVLWHREPGLRMAPDDVPVAILDRARLLLLDAGDPDLARWAARRMRAAGRPTVLDADTPGPQVRALLGEVDHPIVPEAFARETFGTDRLEESLEAMRAAGARGPVITRGPAGAVGLFEGGPIEAPAFAVPVVDTTGAGDVFHGAFAWGLLQQLPPEGLLRLANAAAGMSCGAAGAQGGLPTEQALKDFLRASGLPMDALRR